MSVQWAAPKYVDGDFATAKACGLPVFSSPIPTAATAYLFTQDWTQYLANWAPVAYGTAHPSSGATPDYSDWKLISEGPREDMGGGIVRWKRTYAKIPASYDEWQTMTYVYPGSSPGHQPLAQPGGIFGRRTSSQIVPCRIQNDFFLVPSTFTDPITGASVTATTEADIPVIWQLKVVEQWLDGATQYGGWPYETQYVSDALVQSNIGWMGITTPSATDWIGMIKDAATNGWKATKSVQILTTSGTVVLVDLTSLNTAGHTTYKGQIPAQTSRLTRFQNSGCIWQRQTFYVLAQ